MANINDYLCWRGDIPITDAFPLSEADNAVLARFSYMLFHKIHMEEEETIGSISQKMRGFDNEEFLYNGDKELITFLGESTRFRDLRVTDYVRHNDKAAEKQFGAVTVHLSPREMYLSYIGTDSTIYGWKEDFNMAFMEHVPCQTAGREYAETVAQKYPQKTIRLGGHSKGGNVAMYTALTAAPDIRKRITHVYNYDGPGFQKNFWEGCGKSALAEKIETYIPQDSVIGRLLSHKEKVMIVHSTEKGILQHDIYSWQVERDRFIRCEKNTDTSEDIDKVIKEWLAATTETQRKLVIDAAFELFYSTEANTFGEMSKHLSINLPKILKKYEEIAKEDKDTILHIIRLIGESYIHIFGERQKIKLEAAKEEYASKIEAWKHVRKNK